MHEIIEISTVATCSSPNLMEAYHEIFVGMQLPAVEYDPPVCNREAALELAILMGLDVGSMESITLVGNSSWHSSGPREIIDWLIEGF